MEGKKEFDMKKIVYSIAIPLLLFSVSSSDSKANENDTPTDSTASEYNEPTDSTASEHNEPNDSSVSESTTPQEEKQPLSLSIVQGDGSTVSLTDGSMYQIDPHDWSKSSGWIANAAEVTVFDTQDGSQFPLIITNNATGTTVRGALMHAESMSSE